MTQSQASRGPSRFAAWRLLLVLALTAVCCAGSGRPADALVLDPHTIRSDTLHNGLRVVVCEDETAPVVAVEIVIRAGSAEDPVGKEGIAHLLEHICWGATPQDDPRQRIERIGGLTNAGTLRDYTRFYATVPAGDLALALRALADMVLRESFQEDVLARQRRIILREAAGRMEQAGAVLNDLAYETLYAGQHPYAHRIEGNEESLAAIDGVDILRFHRTWYVPNNMAVVVAGKVAAADVLSHVRKLFGDLAPRALPPRAGGLAVRSPGGDQRVVATALTDTYVMAAFVGPAASEHTEVCASDLLGALLSHGVRGRLYRDLKERRGLVKDVGVSFLTQRDRALFGVWAICSPEHVAAVEESIRGELARAASEPVGPDEMATAKRLLTAGYAFANETAADRAATLSFYEAIDTYRSASYYLQRVRSLTPADISRVAGWYAGEPLWIVLGPGDDRP